MGKAPVVIKIAGCARRANLDGETIERQDEIYIPSYRQWFRQLDTYNHFCFRQTHRLGAGLLCSCGSDAGIFHYDAYMRFQSTYVGDVLACVSLMQYGRHADGSTE